MSAGPVPESHAQPVDRRLQRHVGEIEGQLLLHLAPRPVGCDAGGGEPAPPFVALVLDLQQRMRGENRRRPKRRQPSSLACLPDQPWQRNDQAFCQSHSSGSISFLGRFPRGAEQNHPIVDHTKNLDDAVGSHPIDNEVPRRTHPARNRNPHSAQTRGISADTGKPGDLNGAWSPRFVSQQCHGGQQQQAIPVGRLHAMKSDALQHESCRSAPRLPGSGGRPLFSGGQVGAQPRHHALLKAFSIFGTGTVV
jgi:hypothetical protein